MGGLLKRIRALKKPDLDKGRENASFDEDWLADKSNAHKQNPTSQKNGRIQIPRIFVAAKFREFSLPQNSFFAALHLTNLT